MHSDSGSEGSSSAQIRSGKQRDHVRTHAILVMLGAESLRDGACRGRFVEALIVRPIVNVGRC